MPTANAAPCSDVEVVFARGTTEDPGVGPNGLAFVDSLRSRVGAKSVGVYAVDYPATTAFSTAIQGIADARTHILATAASCPQTKMVLGGFSQGAAVMGFVTANVVPDGVSQDDVPAPMPPEVADHISAVVLFGKPSTRFMRAINDPSIVIGPQYLTKTVDLCVDNDLVCDAHGSSLSVHNQYIETGVVDQGVTFAANGLRASWAAEVPTQQPAAPVPQTPSTLLPVSAPGTPVAPLTPMAPTAGANPSQHLPSAPLTPPGPALTVIPPAADPVV